MFFIHVASLLILLVPTLGIPYHFYKNGHKAGRLFMGLGAAGFGLIVAYGYYIFTVPVEVNAVIFTATVAIVIFVFYLWLVFIGLRGRSPKDDGRA